MLYRTLKRMIQLGQTEGMQEKLDVLYAANRITEAEYTELMVLITPEATA